MKINKEKTELMCISREQKSINIHIDDQLLKQVNEFKYLGSIFAEDGRLNREIESRVKKANTIN
jgi:hypothetical protein